MASPPERLEGLAAAGEPSARLVFRCAACGYVVHGRAVGAEEMREQAERWKTAIRCDECGEEGMGLEDVLTEEEWSKKQPFFVEGG